MTGNSHLIR